MSLDYEKNTSILFTRSLNQSKVYNQVRFNKKSIFLKENAQIDTYFEDEVTILIQKNMSNSKYII